MRLFDKRTPLQKEWEKLEVQEQRFLQKRSEKRESILNQKLEEKIPQGIEGFFQEREPVRLTLRTIGTFGGVHAEREKIYLFENPAVFSVFVKKYPDCAAICGNGQPRLATLLLLDFLKENHSFYYHGDFDPEGLLIAQRLKERYGESICLWNYRADWYERYLSDVNLSEVRMKKLEKVYLPELLEVKMQMQKRKRAAYQEAMLDMLEPEKK